MGRVLFLDDLRTPPFPAEVVRGNDSAIAYLEALVIAPTEDRVIDELWLDYNLGFNVTTEPTAEWLAANAVSPTPIRIAFVLLHTNDTIGRNHLRRILSPHFECVDAEVPRA